MEGPNVKHLISTINTTNTSYAAEMSNVDNDEHVLVQRNISFVFLGTFFILYLIHFL